MNGGAGPRQVVILVTGFGAFPNAPFNPTAALVDRLPRHRPRLLRLGIRLELAVLPVIYAEIEPRLAALVAATRPDVILHFGLAGRRRSLSVETRAVNKLGTLHPDAARRLAGRQEVLAGAAQSIPASYPARRILTALRSARLPAQLSIDAGDYVCNQTLYLSLAAAHAPVVGFVHVPRLRGRCLPLARRRMARPGLADLTDAAVAAILVAAQTVRRGF